MNKKWYVQSVIFDKTKYNKLKLKKWLRLNDLCLLQKGNKSIMVCSDKTYRVRIREPWTFNKKTFKSEKPNKSITIIKGKLK